MNFYQNSQYVRYYSKMIVTLSHNKLTSIPAEIGELESLSSLTLANNHIASIPDTITRCTRLTQFDISHNSLTELPDNLGALTALKKLSVKYNQLGRIPDSIKHCTNIEYLNVENNLLETIDQAVFDQLVNVRIVILSRNQFQKLPIMHNMQYLDSFSGMSFSYFKNATLCPYAVFYSTHKLAFGPTNSFY